MVHMEDGCRLLLEQLYYLSQKSRLDEHILFPEQVAAILESRVEDTNTVVDFLETSGYVKCGRPFGKPYSWVKLTSRGVQLVVDATEYEQAFELQAQTAIDSPTAADGSNVPIELLLEIKDSLHHVTVALEQNDDGPLREFLTSLILKGGLETTVVGVKALLAMYGAAI